MRIGAYELSSQMNIYSRFSADSIKQVSDLATDYEVSKKKENDIAVSLSIDGKEMPKAATYAKPSSNGKVLGSVEKLDDFSLVSSKEDVKASRLAPVEDNNNYKEIISDEQMDSFLKKAFKLYDSI